MENIPSPAVKKMKPICMVKIYFTKQLGYFIYMLHFISRQRIRTSCIRRCSRAVWFLRILELHVEYWPTVYFFTARFQCLQHGSNKNHRHILCRYIHTLIELLSSRRCDRKYQITKMVSKNQIVTSVFILCIHTVVDSIYIHTFHKIHFNAYIHEQIRTGTGSARQNSATPTQCISCI